MELNGEKFVLSLNTARKALQTTDHFVYVTFPMLKEQRLLLKSLEELQDAILNIINAILQFEAYNKRIQISSDAKENFETFKRIAPSYNITLNHIDKIMEILKIADQHKKSPFEFVKNDKIIIMGDGFKTEILSMDKMKNYIIEIKDLLRKATIKINL
jgi:hypothetical protein